MAGRARLRASDTDRERVSERLREAAGEGRLHTEELEQRLETALTAQTYGQLDAVLSDLPGKRIAAPGQRRPLGPVRAALMVTIALAATIAVIAAVILAVTGVFAGWLIWLLVGWWFFGRRGHRYRGYRDYGYGHRSRCGRSLHAGPGMTLGGRTRGPTL
jgi:hypothetical protein